VDDGEVLAVLLAVIAVAHDPAGFVEEGAGLLRIEGVEGGGGVVGPGEVGDDYVVCRLPGKIK
jgi:hypothetical protein